MSDIAIRVNDLWKQYRIGMMNSPYRTFREAIKTGVKQLTGGKRAEVVENHIWALRDVSFDLRQGDVLGIIGRNGAGKSTLLRILAHITNPTKGRVEIHGRVGSLLEVGTGFHNELTGRDNIYLNGAILGMHRVEIDRKFDEIVQFAEVEKFLDTPVKHYSTGMYMRLAFSVAAHLEPEILLVDEVLAVGDTAFQKKCLGKMGEVAKGGRTVLFVSHNMAAIQNLCKNGILLESGQLQIADRVDKVIDKYLQVAEQVRSIPLSERTDRTGNASMKLMDLKVAPLTITAGEEITFTLQVESKVDSLVDVGIGINTREGQPLLLFLSTMVGETIHVKKGANTIKCVVPGFPLSSGYYSLNLCLQKGHEIFDWVKEAGSLEVEESDFFGTGRLPTPNQVPFLVKNQWSHEHGNKA